MTFSVLIYKLMEKESIKKFISITLSVLLCGFIFSCKQAFNESIKDYLAYWSDACQISGIDYCSDNVVRNNIVNLSADKDIEIHIYVINPNKIPLLRHPSGGQCFTLTNETNDLIYTNYKEEAVDTSLIKITAKLTDASQGQLITLSGCIWPATLMESGVSEETMAIHREEYKVYILETSFLQNTPPELVRNCIVPQGKLEDQYYLSFSIPDQTKNKNKNLSFEVDCYVRENNNLTFKEHKVLSLSDNKINSTEKFNYYFPDQISTIEYEYKVTPVGYLGLPGEQVATDPGLGVCYVTDPEFSFSDNGEYNQKTTKKNGIEYEVMEYSGDSLSLYATNTSAGSDMTVTVNGVKTTGDNFSGVLADKEDAYKTIEITVTKDKCYPRKITKNIYAVQKLTEPSITFPNKSSWSNGVIQYRYLKYDNLKMSISNTYKGANASMEIRLDNTLISESDISNYTVPDGNHKLSVTLTKDLCRPVEITEEFKVEIKPVSVSFSGQLLFKADDGPSGNDIDLRGTLYAGTDDTAGVPIKNWSSGHGEYNNGQYYTITNSFELKDPSHKFYFWTSEIYDMDDKAGDRVNDSFGEIDWGEDQGTKTLSKMKEDGIASGDRIVYTFINIGDSRGDSGDMDGGWFNVTFTLQLIDN